MATLKDAEQAREEMAGRLIDFGAHAISVQALEADQDGDLDRAGTAADEVSTTDAGRRSSGTRKARRRASYEVVAWFEDEPPDALPAEVEVQRGSRKVMVPVRVRREERFQVE